MSNAASEGQKRRWAKIPPEKRTQLMAPVQVAKYAKMTKAQRKAHSKMMAEARLKKTHGRLTS